MLGVIATIVYVQYSLEIGSGAKLNAVEEKGGGRRRGNFDAVSYAIISLSVME